MYTVEVRTAILTGDNKIHSWLHITRPEGSAPFSHSGSSCRAP